MSVDIPIQRGSDDNMSHCDLDGIIADDFPETLECRKAVIGWIKHNLDSSLLEGVDSILFRSLSVQDMYLVVTDVVKAHNVSIQTVINTQWKALGGHLDF